MSKDLRWRVVALQIVVTVTFAFTAGFLIWAANFTHGFVHDQLIAQQITFPAANSTSIKALPAADAQAMTQYAGQTMDNGDQAKVWANNFIAVHLVGIGGGKTYDQLSALSMANPKNTTLANQVQTVFRGDTLRSILLNAWGWWTVGTYALYAAIILTLATVAVFLSLIFEVFFAGQKPAGAVRLAA